MNNVPVSFMVMALVAVAIFALIIGWLIRELIRLDKRIDYMRDALHQWNEIDQKVHKMPIRDKFFIRFKTLDNVRD